MGEFFKIHNVVFLTLAIAGLAFGIYSYYATQQSIVVSYYKSSTIIFDDLPKDFKITSRSGPEIGDPSRIMRTRFVIWNSGTQPVGATDLRRPFQLAASSGVRVLRAAIIGRYPDYSNFAAEIIDEREISLSWSYFDPGFSVFIDVLHTGSRDSIIPTIAYIGGKSILDERDWMYPGSTLAFSWIFLTVAVVIGIVWSQSYIQSRFGRRREWVAIIVLNVFLLSGVAIVAFVAPMMANAISGGTTPDVVAKYMREDDVRKKEVQRTGEIGF